MRSLRRKTRWDAWDNLPPWVYVLIVIAGFVLLAGLADLMRGA